MRMNSVENTVEEILIRNYDKYYRLAYSYVHNESDAKDIIQEGAYRAILKCDTLRKEEYAGTWIYRIMLNEIFRFLEKRKHESLESIEDVFGVEDNYIDVDLQNALLRLDPKDKVIVELRFFEEMKLEEISEVLEENLSTIKSRLYRSMEKLKGMLN